MPNPNTTERPWRRKFNRGHLGFHPADAMVVLGKWVFRDKSDPGHVEPMERRDAPYHARWRVVGNYASTTGVVVVEHETTKARTEFDAFTPARASAHGEWS